MTMAQSDSMAIVKQYQANPPVNLELMAKELGVVVSYCPMERKVAGKLTRFGSQDAPEFHIHINSDDPPNRQRFTLAHEIAHFILHRDLIEDSIIDNTMYRSNLKGIYETQANQLAADILMPRHSVRICHSKCSNVAEIAGKFNVSEQAMRIRLDGLKLLQTSKN